MHLSVIQVNSGNHTVHADEATALRIAADLQADDDCLTYRVKVDPKGTGKAIIEVVDEGGNVIDCL